MDLDLWQTEVLSIQGNLHLRAGRQVGKSTIVSLKAAEFSIANPKKTVMVIAFTERQAYLLFEKILAYLTQKYQKWIKKGKDKPTKHEIKLTNGTRILCLPTGMTGFGIMGYSIDLLIVDEAAFVPDEVYRSVIPSLAVTHGTIWLLSTPCGSAGYFYDTSKDDSFTHVHISSEDCPRKDQAFLDHQKLSLTKAQYAQWYLGEFVTAFNRLFSDEIIKRSCILKRRTEILKDRTYYLGCDLARMGGDAITFEVLDKLDREHIDHTESIVHIKKLTTETEDNILKLHKLWNFKRIGIDAGAGTLGVSILDHLLREDSAKNKVVALNNRAISLDNKDATKQRLMKEDMYFNLLRLLERGWLRLLDDDEVMLSLASVQYEYDNEQGKRAELRIFGTNTHIAEGLIRAAWLACEDKSLNLWAA
ncbi:MAG: terminase family protein [Candidatus Pacebacteria bacterium]|nr:terminase family protein [Candidatus Paceibacterota bacterium]